MKGSTPTDTGAPPEVLARLLRAGAEELSDLELLSLVVGRGTPLASEQDAGLRALRDTCGFDELARQGVAGLRALGLDPGAISAILAALEIGRRVARAEVPHRRPMQRPEAVARYLRFRYATLDQEIMGALYLDSRNKLIGEKEIYRGTLNRAAVEPRGVLKEALIQNAASFILFHTHPSGDPAPSVEDLAFTRRMARCAELLGLRLTDHLIVCPSHRWSSLRSQGGW